jgi:hypothetical protein
MKWAILILAALVLLVVFSGAGQGLAAPQAGGPNTNGLTMFLQLLGLIP